MTTVILRCPRCHSRKEVPYDDWVKSVFPLSTEPMLCENALCDKYTMLYHKDGDNHVKHNNFL